MKKILLLTLLLLFVHMPSLSAAPDQSPPGTMTNDPTGFRGIAWGTHIDSVKDQMVFIEHLNNSDINHYYRKNDSLQIGSVTFDKITYSFSSDKLSGVSLDFSDDNAESFRYLLKLLQERFGDNPEIYEGLAHFSWYGENTKITFMYSAPLDKRIDRYSRGSGWILFQDAKRLKELKATRDEREKQSLANAF